MNKQISKVALLAGISVLSLPAFAGASVSTDGGIKVKDADKGYSFELDGRVMWDFAIFDNDDRAGAGQNISGSEFRRIRLTAKGSAFGWSYVIQPDFADNSVTMKDLYIAKGLGQAGKLLLGQFKVPFSLEELTSSKYITIQERSNAAGFSSSHQMGVGLFGNAGAITWGAAAYNLDDNDSEFNNGTGIGARLSFAPVNTDNATVHLGLAAASESYGLSSDGGHERYRLRYRSVGHMADASRPTLLDLNNAERVKVGKLGLEAAGVAGPFSLQAEIAMIDAEDNTEEGEASTWYLQASWVLTGERRGYKASAGTFDKIKPKGDGGAWELAIRADHAQGEENPIGAALTRDTELEILTAGVNWYPNVNTRLTLQYWTAEISNQLSNTVVDKPSAITGRVQFYF